jgi:hypothetical protein
MIEPTLLLAATLTTSDCRIAIGLHFVVNDFGLHEHHKWRYRRYGRWILAATILAGWALGAATTIHRALVAVLFAFLAGGVIMNVIKEELPKERESRFVAFVSGLVLYAALDRECPFNPVSSAHRPKWTSGMMSRLEARLARRCGFAGTSFRQRYGKAMFPGVKEAIDHEQPRSLKCAAESGPYSRCTDHQLC